MAKNRMPETGVAMFRSGVLERQDVEGQENQYEISFSSEEPYARWGDAEVLLHEAGAVDLSRFEDVGTLLFSHGHDPNYGRVPIGKVVRAWLDESDRKCKAIIQLDEEDEACKRLQSKLKQGMLRGVSVGYSVGAWTRLEPGQKSADGRFVGPMYIAAQWTPHEISLEPVPADPTVGLGKNFDNEEDNHMSLKTGNPATAPEGTVTPAAVPAANPTPEGVAGARSQDPELPAAGSADSAALERARVLEISNMCRSFDIDAESFIRDGVSVADARTAVLEKLQRRGASNPVDTGGRGEVTIVKEEIDKVRSAATDGLLMRCGVSVAKPADGAREFRGMSLHDIAVECLVRSGVSNAHRMSKDELLKRSMTPDSAFSAIASEVANRTVLAAHETAPTTFQHWTSKATSSDFRPTDIYEISASGELDEIPQNGEFKEGKLSDAPVATRRLLTFGKIVSFTRQMFINDDISLITRTLTAYTLAFQRGINKAVYQILKNNPTMRDGYTLFSANHKNLGTGAVPGTASFSEARKLMRQQKDLGGGVTLNISPSFVLASSADETPVEALLASLADPSSNNSGVANVFRNKMQLIVDAELDVDSGAQPYYFAADPRLADTIEVSYLNGVEQPMVEMQADFDTLGFRYRVYGDRGVTLTGYRGLVKNPGKSTE